MVKPFVTARFEGGRELEDFLKQLPKAMGKVVLRRAAQKALRPVLEAAERNVDGINRVSGRYAQSYSISTKLIQRERSAAERAGGLGDVNVYVGSSDWKAMFLEYGTSKMSAQPVLRPAWDENEQEVFRIFQEELAKELLRAARKLASKALKGTLTAKQRALLR